jgi:GNAT superfamily N-acetyltransferase
MKVKLIPVNRTDANELEWLFQFIDSNHTSVPKYMHPTLESLRNPTFFYFKAIATEPKKLALKIIGVTSYEVRTPYLAETQKTVVAPEFRRQGWGKVLSEAIEQVVKKAGFYKIRSCIYATNLPMLQIKLAQGYIIEGYHPDHDGPGLHEYSLGKIIGKKK